jgi:hypothetical protein
MLPALRNGGKAARPDTIAEQVPIDWEPRSSSFVSSGSAEGVTYRPPMKLRGAADCAALAPPHGNAPQARYFVRCAVATAALKSCAMAAEISPSVVTEKNSPGEAQLCRLGPIWL